jgi:hypothetical protein
LEIPSNLAWFLNCARPVDRAGRLYSGFVSAWKQCTGHTFQGRFGFEGTDDAHVLAAARQRR